MALKLARIESRLTQKELAEKVGVTQQTIAKWERGISTPNHFKDMREIEKVLGKPIEQMFADVFRDQEPVT
ncbi:transcriptional regulator [Vibrio phage vB_VpaM_XM1]